MYRLCMWRHSWMIDTYMLQVHSRMPLPYVCSAATPSSMRRYSHWFVCLPQHILNRHVLLHNTCTDRYIYICMYWCKIHLHLRVYRFIYGGASDGLSRGRQMPLVQQWHRHIRTSVGVYLCMFEWMFVCMYVCMYVGMYVVCVCMLHTSICLCIEACVNCPCLHLHVSVDMCIRTWIIQVHP